MYVFKSFAAVSANTVENLAGEEINGLVLSVVILNGQLMTRFDVQNLAYIALGDRPNGLVTPRFGYVLDLCATAAPGLWSRHLRRCFLCSSFVGHA